MDGLYVRIAEDLAEGKPLIVTSYYGMWFTRQGNPERNLNWGTRDGHYTMLSNAGRSRQIKKAYRHSAWSKVHYEKAGDNPIRVAVFKQLVRPERKWKELGVEKPFAAYLIMLAYDEHEHAGLDMARNLFDGSGIVVELEDGTALDTAESQVVGYMGHNFFYHHEDYYFPDIQSLRKAIPRPRGIFAIGCKTGELPGFKDLPDKNVHVVLLTHDFMAVEGHATLSIMDGLAGMLSGKEIARLADRTYRSFRKLHDPDATPGRHYWSHEHFEN